jgi:hypothetical protein
MACKAQTVLVAGKITGDKNDALPFASVLVKGTNLGTNANADGFYALKLQPGTYQLIFQYVGYKKKTETVLVEANTTHDVNLSPESYELKEVVIKGGEDPAYAVIRQAIKKRKQYLNEIDAYSCKAYIKGLQRLKNYPEKMAKLINKIASPGNQIDSSLLGVIYLSESESKYHYRKPDEEKEIMYSSRVSGDNKTFSFNQVSDLKFNTYENLVSLGNLSDRPFISPINQNAFLSYRYKLLGTTFEDGKMLNKIQVIPKRSTDPCFRGIIYIQENTWRVHSVDLYITKESKIKFVDTLQFRQLNSPVNDTAWMQTSFNMMFSFKIMGFEGDGYFNVVCSEYDLHPVFPKNFFKNEVLVIEEGSNKKDSAYWKTARPVPLTEEEKTDYVKKDSISVIENSDRYKDSLDRKGNKFNSSDLILGYSYTKTKRGFSLITSGLLNSGLQYNTVEGINASAGINMEKHYEDKRKHVISASTRYGFSNYLWSGAASWQYFNNPKKFESFRIKVGSTATQFNGEEGINSTVNSAYTLLLNDNFMKLYKKTYASFSYRRELINGLIMNFNTEYAERSALRNTANDIWIDDRRKLFTSNDPLRPNTDDSSFSVNNAFIVELGFSIRFRQKYDTRPYEKVIVGSKYPIITISYTKAIPGLNTVIDYDLLKLTINDRIRLGLVGRFSYRLKAGYFLNTRRMEFMDYKHFEGNQTIYLSTDYLNSYKLLPYYTYSTNQWYAEAHAEHHFNGFIFNKIPLLKKTRLQEVIGGHALFSDKLNQYYELNFGVERIFRILRVDYVMGYGPGTTFRQGVVASLRLRF